MKYEPMKIYIFKSLIFMCNNSFFIFCVFRSVPIKALQPYTCTHADIDHFMHYMLQ